MEKGKTSKKPARQPASKKPAVQKNKESYRVAKKTEQKICGTGRRKTSVARVEIYPGEGVFKINGRALEKYVCGRIILITTAKKALELTNLIGKYDVFSKISGGGISSQIGALAHGLSRALIKISADFKPVLKKAGLLSRDSRMKERKKYGHKRARKSFQYSKR